MGVSRSPLLPASSKPSPGPASAASSPRRAASSSRASCIASDDRVSVATIASSSRLRRRSTRMGFRRAFFAPMGSSMFCRTPPAARPPRSALCSLTSELPSVASVAAGELKRSVLGHARLLQGNSPCAWAAFAAAAFTAAVSAAGKLAVAAAARTPSALSRRSRGKNGFARRLSQSAGPQPSSASVSRHPCRISRTRTPSSGLATLTCKR
mmetsp:Transcript_6911/g.28310  ORF Transcript_6911/g.28310 Transcript_6911/m.28310 type:complete len:210 (+) Transcript_6911:167-796(+)